MSQTMLSRSDFLMFRYESGILEVLVHRQRVQQMIALKDEAEVLLV